MTFGTAKRMSLNKEKSAPINKNDKTFVFVNLAIDAGYFGVHHGIASLVPVVKEFGYDVHVLQVESDIGEQEFREQVQALNPSIVGYSFTSLQIKFLKRYSRAIESLPNILQIAGGTGATLNPHVPDTAVNGFAIGEGEAPLNALLRAIEDCRDIVQVKGFAWHRDGKTVTVSVMPFVDDISTLDFPDYTVFERDKVIYGSPPNINVMLSRGCPYKCYYCSNHALRSVYESSHGYTRRLTPDNAILLLGKLRECYPEVEFLNFEDDLLIANKKWFLEFASKYKKQIRLPCRLNLRVECVNPEIIASLKEIDCRNAFLGVESGNERFRRKMLNRKHTNQDIVEKARLVRDADIKLFTFNIVGFPHETKEQMIDTLNLNKQIKPDTGVCTYFYPFPGTELFNICKRDGFLDNLDIENLPSNYNTRPIIPRSDREKKDCTRVMKKMNAYLEWQNLKYNISNYKREHNVVVVVTYTLGLLGFYLLRRLVSHNHQLRIYHFLTNTPLLRIIARSLVKGTR